VISTIVESTSSEPIVTEYRAVLALLPGCTDGSSRWDSEMLSPDLLDAVESFGKACPDPGNFQASLLILLTTKSYTEAVRRNILAGGCNCSRANFLGAYMGAIFGIGGEDGIPFDWIQRTDKGLETMDLAIKAFGL
jgi:hypothetical protein